MRSRSFRISSVIVLVLALFLLSGLATTVSAAIAASAQDTCCTHQQGDTQRETAPCPECYCPCASCLTCEALETFSASLHPLEIPSLHHFISELHAKAFVESIDYPPELA